MSHIPPIDQVLRSLRAQPLLDQAATQAVDKSAGTGQHGASKPQRSADAVDHVVRQIRAIQDEDPQRQRRAFRAFLEGRLIGLMGKEALHSPAFSDLLEQVQETMSSNREMARAIDAVADFLLTNGATPAVFDKLANAFRTVSAPVGNANSGVAEESPPRASGAR